MQAGKKQKTKI